jgi:hypothetical protein
LTRKGARNNVARDARIRAPKGLPMRPIALLATGIAALALAACASGPDVRVEYDKAAPFDSYKSFAFESPTGTERAGQPILSRYLAASTRRELEARGLRYDDKAPDLRVNFNARIADKTSVNAPAPLAAGYYGYRPGSYSTWSGYPWGDTKMSYTEGTLNVDVVDTARKQLVWESVAVGAITDAKLQDLQGSVDGVVKAAFEKFPRAPAK